MNQPSFDRNRVRTTAGILIFIGCCLLSSLRLMYNAPNPFHIQVDDIAQRAEKRFAELRTQLPNRGVIGYVGPSGNVGTEDYYLAQYALAPLVIDHSPNHPVVIGSFPDVPPLLPQNLQPVRNFGNGVLLLSNKDAK